MRLINYLRSTFLMILVASSTLVINAHPISPGEAKSIASEFFISCAGPKRAPKAVEMDSGGSNSQSTQPYYIFNAEDGEGFVIVAGDTRAKKILGYSDKGSFNQENIPPQLVWLLSEYEKGMESIPSNTAAPYQSISRSDGQSYLLKTQWGQGAPYNAKCPVVDGVKTVTGCVATAMAQIINYENKTSHVTEIPEYSCAVYMPSLPSYEFDFGYLDQEGIATLMLYCGQSVKMDYNPEESGSAIEDVPYALRHYFGWDAEVRVLKRKNFTDENWNNMVKDKVSQGHPLLYSAVGDRGGHAFVIDGFSSDLFHVNWGWEGYMDGYYSFQPFASEHKSEFIDMQAMVTTPSSIEFSGGFPKNVVIEEATGTWCGYCPRGIVMCDYIREHYPDRIFPIAVHQGDKMEIDEYSEFFNNFVSSFPTAIVNREEAMDISASGADLLYDEIKDQLSYARVDVTSQLVGNKLLINAETEFAVDIESEHRLVFVVVEDGVGPYFQSNYYTNTNEFGLGMWETAGNNVLCHFDDVARHINTYNGIEGSLPNSITAGEVYRYSTTMDLTNVTSPSCKVVAMILNCQYGSIINANQFTVEASEGVYINKSNLEMAIGDTEKLIAYLNGTPLNEDSVVWKSSDESVVIVDSDGLVEAVGPGNAVIGMSCDAGEAQCQVIVEIVGSIFEIEGIRYKITGDETCMVAFPKEGERYMMERIVIPSQIDVLGRSFEVTELEFSMQTFTGAFYGSPNLEEIELPNTITYLPGDVFEGCVRLKKFKSPSSVKFIDAYAFMGCSSLSDLELNEGLSGVWTESFGWCDSLKNIVLPSTMESMGREVFYGTHPYWIYSKALVPPALQGDLFHDEFVSEDYEDCALIVPESSLEAYKEAEYWNRFEMIVPDDVILSRYKLNMNPGDVLGLEVLNSEGQPVTWSSSDPAVVQADQDGTLRALSVGEAYVTAECKGKTAACKVIVSGEGLTLKYGDLWYEIKGPSTCGVTRNMSSDEPYELDKVTIPATIDYAGHPIDVVEICHNAFSRCRSMLEISFPASLRHMDSGALESCDGLTELVLNEGLESLAYWSITKCTNLKSIVLPSTLQSMGSEAFRRDTPSRIQCKAILPPALEGDLFDDSDLSPVYSKCVLIVPAAALDQYRQAEYWNRFARIVSDDVILNHYVLDLNPGDEVDLEVLNNDGSQVVWTSSDPSVVAIDAAGRLKALSVGEATVTAECNGHTEECIVKVSMEGMKGKIGSLWYRVTGPTTCEVIAPEDVEYYDMESIDIPSSVTLFGREYTVTSLGDEAFLWNFFLKHIAIPNTVTHIGEDCFNSCYELTDVQLPSSLESIGDYAFQGCSILEQIELPDGLQSIGIVAFGACRKLAEIEIPRTVTEIKVNTFFGCESLSNVKFSETLEVIDNLAFEGCRSLEEVILPSSMKFLGWRCFVSTGLRKIQITGQKIPEATDDIFEDEDPMYDTCELVVREELLNEYRQHPIFGKFLNIRGYSSVDCIIAADAPIDIYTTNGNLLRRAVNAAEIQDLSPGLYIIRQGDKTAKLLK